MSVPPPTIDQLLAAHPWPKELAGAPRLEWLWHFELAMPLDAVWPLVADTSRLNRALGTARMHFEDRGNERWGRSVQGGVVHEWREVPWNWVVGQHIESVRLYERGFMKAVYGVFTFEALEAERTRVNVYFGIVPRHFFGKVAINFGFPSLQKDFTRVFGELEQQYTAVKSAKMPVAPPEPLSPDASSRLATVAAKMKKEGLDATAVDQLINWISTGDEQDLYRIQIRERAAAWNVDERELLRVALHATREGVLEISWDLICPHCRGVAEEYNALGRLTSKGECKVCEIDFDSKTGEAVEITFHVHQSVRAVEKRTYCSAEPATKDHIRVQYEVAPGAELKVSPSLNPGSYRLRVHGHRDYGFLDVSDSGASSFAWKADTKERVAVNRAPALTLQNTASEARRFILEACTWSDYALRPGQLFSLQEYRDLFSEDYLAADVQLAVGEQTILFTDIVGSTAMYAARGDPAAFVEVRRHFTDVFEVIAKHRGAVVKTIGDAVMAAFNDPLDAVKAAHDIHAAFPPGRGEMATKLRISLNTGACIAVKLNTGIDYFGHTVNVAAKLQSLCESWQVAMSQSTYGASGVAAWLEQQRGSVVAMEYTSKALAAPVAVKQWTVFSSVGV
ncbi:MAG: DUF5939 domain-containing protein [Archangium sp.]